MRETQLPTNRKRSILVSLKDHRISFQEGRNTVKVITDFATGRLAEYLPIIENGKIDPLRRERMHFSETDKDPLGNSAAMPFALFVQGMAGCAFHAGMVTPESKGCIHLRRTDAEWLFNWVGKSEIDLQILR